VYRCALERDRWEQTRHEAGRIDLSRRFGMAGRKIRCVCGEGCYRPKVVVRRFTLTRTLALDMKNLLGGMFSLIDQMGI
jgi:hypothetical protein